MSKDIKYFIAGLSFGIIGFISMIKFLIRGFSEINALKPLSYLVYKYAFITILCYFIAIILLKKAIIEIEKLIEARKLQQKIKEKK